DVRHEPRPGLRGAWRAVVLCQRPSRRRIAAGPAQRQGRDTGERQRRALPAIPARQALRLEGRLGNDQAMTTGFRATMRVAILAALSSGPAHAQSGFVLRYGDTSPWPFDGRDDHRDFGSNGSFPGNFATNPSSAWIGAAGLIGSNPQRSR